jgi:hypothetical protein
MIDEGAGGALLEVARSLRLRILAERDSIESARRLPEDLTRELARAEFFRICSRRGTGSWLTLCWREMDSNFQFLVARGCVPFGDGSLPTGLPKATEKGPKPPKP